ncbi:MAG: NTP transferase domain-containing protein [Candidatus Omnitrophica bacterium]|nr:NTP transferase domain-containing protein [Candidatus Omnitrophota bacterium]MCB9747610.1 NTP transferase domain-containing protein [Candidatus Omnitrophota bacterium]
MKEIRAIILAAGKGTRMKSSTPKVLHTVCGEPIIQYVLDVAKEVGSKKIYAVLGHGSSQVREYLGTDIYTVEQQKLLGTADAVRCVEKQLNNYKGDVLILCGDTPLLRKSVIKNILRKHKKTNAVCTFLTAVVHNPDGYGRIIRGDSGDVVAIREDKDAVGYEREIAEINVGVYCFKSADLFKALKQIKLNPKKKEFYLTDIIEIFYENKVKIESVETEDSTEGLGINTRNDLAVAEGILRQRILKELMLSGVTIIDPKTTFIDGGVKIGEDTVIRPFTVIEKDVTIGKKCAVGPFCRIRSGSKIADHVQLGNFTEVSRSKVGPNTIMKHFGYLGDSLVGANVNIGAGAVTANYDGQAKNVTKISDGAFVGSDSVLIAPVRVGKNAYIGAGSVVTKGKSIPDSSIAVGVPAKVISKKKK